MNSVNPAAERTQGACQPVTSVYSQVAPSVIQLAIPAGTKQSRSTSSRNAESTAIWVPEITMAWNVPVERIRGLVETHTEGRQLGFLGEARVNVLLLNLALDGK